MCINLFMDTGQTVAVQLIILIMHIFGTVVTMADSLDWIYVRLYPPYEVFFFVCLFLAWQPPVGQSLLIHEVSSSHTQRRTTVGRISLEEWSVRRRDLYLTKHDTHNRQTSMSPVGFEPTISAGERSQTYALSCAATGNGFVWRVKAVPLQAWCGLEGSRKLRFPDFMKTAQDGGKAPAAFTPG